MFTVKKQEPDNSKFIINSLRSKRTDNNNIWSLFDINFLKKERIYTKLKYSRSPQYDIVSGGVAALFAGFLGFLISEKFGIELVDSGDFYTLFMYFVFICFSLRPFLKVLDQENTIWQFFSYKFLLNYLKIIFNLFICFLSKIFFKDAKSKWFSLSYFFSFVEKNEYLSITYKTIRRTLVFLKYYPSRRY